MIPKNVTYICKPEIEVGFRWDDSPEDKLYKARKVIPAFCSDSDNKKTIETGRSWARENRYSNRGIDNTSKIEEFSFKNEIIKEVELVSLEKRSEGGRAWKVLVYGHYYFDLREDVLLDILLTDTVKNGIIKAGLIWTKIGSQMKLVRWGSELYQMAIDSGNRKESKNIKNPEIGGVYENRKGEQFLYLGKVKTKKEKIIDVSGQLWLGIPTYNKDKELLDKYDYVETNYRTDRKTLKYYFLSSYSEVVKSKAVITKLEQTGYSLEMFRGLNKEAITINEAILV